MISVIIPVYNRAHSIKRCIDSVLCQTYSDFEIILVNDCSTDETESIIQSIKDDRVILIKTLFNSGAANARNLGIKKAKGDIISFLDSDDYYEPEILEISNEMLTHSSQNIGFIWTGVRYIDEKLTKEGCWKPKFFRNSYLTFLTSLHIGTNSGISCKKIVFEKCGYFNEKLPAAEDTDFFLRITQHFDYSYSEKILINIDKSGTDRLSKDYRKIALSYNSFIKNHLNEIDKSKILQKKYYYKLMWLNFHLGERENANAYYNKLKRLKLIDKKIFLVRTAFNFLPTKIAVRLHLLSSMI